MKRFEVVTFDCYGTLIDWESGISDAFLAAANIEGVQLERAEVLAAYMKIEPIVEPVPTARTARCSARRPNGWRGTSVGPSTTRRPNFCRRV